MRIRVRVRARYVNAQCDTVRWRKAARTASIRTAAAAAAAADQFTYSECVFHNEAYRVRRCRSGSTRGPANPRERPLAPLKSCLVASERTQIYRAITRRATFARYF